MTNRDYILRMIEQFGQMALALRKLIFGIGTGSQDVRDRLRGLASQAGLDLDLARAATPETLMMFAAPSGEIEPTRCWMFAETLYLDGVDAILRSDFSRARSSLIKAEILFALVAPCGAFLVGFPEAQERVEEIQARLAELDARTDQPNGRKSKQRNVGLRRRAAIA